MSGRTYLTWETVDPEIWVPWGYAVVRVDSRGAGRSPGYLDIFSPRDYPAEWLADQVLFWNEQYLLEAFLSHNDRWRVRAALNRLHRHYRAIGIKDGSTT